MFRTSAETKSKDFGPLSYLLPFPLTLWISNIFLTEDYKIAIFLALGVGYTFLYYKLFVKGNWQPSRSSTSITFLIFFLVTPSFLQTDQFRYIWDGLITALGENPYQLAPIDHRLFQKFFWSEWINHAELPTIYPPLSQILFGISSFFNPSFLSFFLPSIKLSFPEHPQIIEWGWRLLLGLLSFLAIRRRQDSDWALFFFHPAFLFFGLANLHVDAILGIFCLLFMKKLFEGTPFQQVLVLAGALLIKFTPFLCLPLFFYSWQRTHGLRHAIANISLLILLVATAVWLLSHGQPQLLLLSMKAYESGWSFFGVIFRILVDFNILFLSGNPFKWARPMTYFIGLLTLFILFVQISKHTQLSLRFKCCLFSGAFLFFIPTLHPWYFLFFLFLGLPYLKALWTLWLWPCIWLSSEAFYFENSDPTLLRYLCYVALVAVLIRDYKALQVSSKEFLYAS